MINELSQDILTAMVSNSQIATAYESTEEGHAAVMITMSVRLSALFYSVSVVALKDVDDSHAISSLASRLLCNMVRNHEIATVDDVGDAALATAMIQKSIGFAQAYFGNLPEILGQLEANQ